MDLPSRTIEKWLEQSFDFTRSELDGCKHLFSACSPGPLLKMIQFSQILLQRGWNHQVFLISITRSTVTFLFETQRKTARKSRWPLWPPALWVEVSVEVTLGSEFLSYHINVTQKCWEWTEKLGFFWLVKIMYIYISLHTDSEDLRSAHMVERKSKQKEQTNNLCVLGKFANSYHQRSLLYLAPLDFTATNIRWIAISSTASIWKMWRRFSLQPVPRPYRSDGSVLSEDLHKGHKGRSQNEQRWP